MEHEDDLKDVLVFDQWYDDNMNSSTVPSISVGNITIESISDSMFDDSIIDTTYNICPTDLEPTVYTSYEQRAQHEKYPALQKAWEDYLTMYALTKGEPPIVD